jgi:diguanylate cyclase (GGDEF)-like protein
MSFQHPRLRLRTDFQFAIFVLFCVVAMLGIGPFAVYRFLNDETLTGIADTLIVASLAGALAYVWRGGNVERASGLVVIATTVGCVAVGKLIGLPGALWSFPAIFANFLLIGRLRALAASVVVILALVIEGGAFGSLHERAMYFASASVSCLFAYAFARRTSDQREQLELLASRDPLTGVCNRRAMERELLIAAEAFRRHRVPVGLAVLDIDHFKRVNDAFGHETGDQVLVEFARIVQARGRAGDRLFRHGGEEFVMLLPGTDGAALRAVSEDLRAAVATQLHIGDHPVTVSIGAAALEPDEDVNQWLARADAAMYQAKREGRDRVVVAGSLGAAAGAAA